LARVVPTCLALILCEAVKRPKGGDDPSVLRTFTVLNVPALPTATPPLSVWIHLTDGNGPTTIDLCFEHLPAGRLEPEVVAATRVTLNFADPNLVLEHEVVLHDGIYLERSGRYRLRLTADGAPLVHRYFIVQLRT